MYMYPHWYQPAFFAPGPLYYGGGIFLCMLVALAAWSIVWKGFALWHAARNGQKWWFIPLLVINTLGILEIIYLVWFRKDAGPKTPSLFSAPTDAASASEPEVLVVEEKK